MTTKVHLVLYTVKVPTGLILEFLGIPAIGASEVIQIIPQLLKTVKPGTEQHYEFDIGMYHLL